jgi:hypothetical protein
MKKHFCRCLVFMLMAPFFLPPSVIAQRYPVSDADTYILDKLVDHDIVFIGTVHRQPRILRFMADVLPQLKENGVTHLALEVASDQQGRIDRFMRTGYGIDSIRLHRAIDCPGYRHLFQVLGQLDPDRRPRVVAIDLPRSQYDGAMSRNEYMAMRLASIVQPHDPSHSAVKILCMLGGSHVLRRLKWQNRLFKNRAAIRTYLEQWHPELRMFSLMHIVDQMAKDGDFSRRLSPMKGAVALDLDQRFKGWHLGVTACMALAPSQPYDLVDGVIVY